MPPLLADFSHARACKPFCEKYLTLPAALHAAGLNGYGTLLAGKHITTLQFRQKQAFNLVSLILEG